MTVSEKGKALIETFESLSLCPYLDTDGVVRQGYGHASGAALDGPPCSLAQAVAWLSEDLAYVEGLMAAHVTIPLKQGQYDAVASLIYNVGPGRRGLRDGVIELKAGGPSTLLKLLNRGDIVGSSAEFTKWALVNGHPSIGLFRRRRAEQILFDTP